jgi:hypothetical protein
MPHALNRMPFYRRLNNQMNWTHGMAASWFAGAFFACR